MVREEVDLQQSLGRQTGEIVLDTTTELYCFLERRQLLVNPS